MSVWSFSINFSFSSPGSIGLRKEIIIFPGYLIKLFFGQTFPVFNATGTHGYFKVSYILPTPFLKGG